MNERSRGSRLVLLRHGEAEPAGPMADVDRPLTPRGRLDATAAGAWLSQGGWLPDLVICSPTQRARQTWHGAALGIVQSPAGRTPTVRYESRVYTGSTRELLELVRSADPQVCTLLLVGHNPAISELSLLLDPEDDRGSAGLPTTGLAVHQSTGGWADFGAGTAPLVAWHAARAG